VVVAFTVVVEASVSKVVSDVLSDLPEQELTAKKAIAITIIARINTIKRFLRWFKI
jgi:hypothetical protein